MRSPCSGEVKTRCLHHHSDDLFLSILQSYVLLILAEHHLIYLCGYYASAWRHYSSGSCSLTSSQCYIADPEKQIGSKRAVTGNHSLLPQEAVRAPAWSHGYSTGMSWFSCVDYRCCVLLVLLHALFNRSYDLCADFRYSVFLCEELWDWESEPADLKWSLQASWSNKCPAARHFNEICHFLFVFDASK